MLTAIIGLGHKGIPSRKLLSYSTSSSALSKVINLASIVDRVFMVCFEDFHEMVAPPSVNTYPLVDLLFEWLEIQFASQYPSNTGGYFV